MQGHTYTLISVLAADGLPGLFVAILRVSLTCTCMDMLVSLTMRQHRIRQAHVLSPPLHVSHRLTRFRQKRTSLHDQKMTFI